MSSKKNQAPVNKKIISSPDVKSSLDQASPAVAEESSAPQSQDQDFEKHPKFDKFKKQGDN